MKVEVNLDDYINYIINKSAVDTIIQYNEEHDLIFPKGELLEVINKEIKKLTPMIDEIKDRINNHGIPRPKC